MLHMIPDILNRYCTYVYLINSFSFSYPNAYKFDIWNLAHQILLWI